MSKFGLAVLAGVGSAAGEYHKIQSEQRQYNMQQQAAQAQMERDQNFARFGHSLKDSGMVRKDTGESITNEQWALMGPEERKQHESKQDRTFRQGQEEADAKTLSQWMDPETKEVLTNAQVKQYKEEGRKMVTKTAHQEARQDEVTAAKQEAKQESAAELQEIRQELAEAKSDKQFLSTFRTQLNKSIDPQSSNLENHQAVGQLINVMSDDPRIMKEKIVVAYMDTENMADDIMKGFDKGMSLDKIKAAFKKQGRSDKDIQLALDVLESKGQLEKGWIPGTGYKGRGR